MVDAFQVLRGANYEPTGVLLNPRTATSYAKFKDTTNQPLRAPDAVTAVSQYTTNQIGTAITLGTSNDTSDVFVGDWRMLAIGLRTTLQLAVLREAFVSNGQFGFFAYARADIAVLRPTAFNVIRGLRP